MLGDRWYSQISLSMSPTPGIDSPRSIYKHTSSLHCKWQITNYSVNRIRLFSENVPEYTAKSIIWKVFLIEYAPKLTLNNHETFCIKKGLIDLNTPCAIWYTPMKITTIYIHTYIHKQNKRVQNTSWCINQSKQSVSQPDPSKQRDKTQNKN